MGKEEGQKERKRKMKVEANERGKEDKERMVE
jgi:hypothetical protein